MPMSSAQLNTLLTQGLKDDLSYLELRVHLINFKEEGGDQKEALSILEDIHTNQTDQEIKDRLEELMDLTEGLGIKALRVW